MRLTKDVRTALTEAYAWCDVEEKDLAITE
jgi:hypothetical protein